MATLTAQQQAQYYASQGNAANPLTPGQWLAQQNSGNTPSPAPVQNQTIPAPGTATANQNDSPYAYGPNLPPISPVIDTTSGFGPGSALNHPLYTPPSTNAPVITWTYLNTANSTLEQAQEQNKTLSQQQKDAQKALDDALAARKAVVDAEKNKTQAEQDNILGNINNLTQPFRENYEMAQRDALHVNENFEENQKLTNELKTLLTEGNDLIAQQKGVTGLASIRNPRINQAIESVNARVGVIQAVMAARNSQISVANNLIDRGLNAITADKKDQLSYYNTLLQLNNDKLLNLSNESKTLANAQITQLENSLNRVNESADYLKKLMITPESATYIANAGVTLNDTVGEINAKLAAYGNQQEVTKTANEFTSNGYKQTPIKTNNSIEVSVGGKTLYFIPPAGYDMVGNKTATTKSTTTKSTAGTAGKALSQNALTQFENMYGWKPPFGVTDADLAEYIAANPGASPEELEAGLVAALGGNSSSSTSTEKKESKGFFSSLWDKITGFFK